MKICKIIKDSNGGDEIIDYFVFDDEFVFLELKTRESYNSAKFQIIDKFGNSYTTNKWCDGFKQRPFIVKRQ